MRRSFSTSRSCTCSIAPGTCDCSSSEAMDSKPADQCVRAAEDPDPRRDRSGRRRLSQRDAHRAAEVADLVRHRRGGDAVAPHQLLQSLLFALAHFLRGIHRDGRQARAFLAKCKRRTRCAPGKSRRSHDSPGTCAAVRRPSRATSRRKRVGQHRQICADVAAAQASLLRECRTVASAA